MHPNQLVGCRMSIACSSCTVPFTASVEPCNLVFPQCDHALLGILLVVTKFSWGCSSSGRAPALQAGGTGFESPQLHHSFRHELSDLFALQILPSGNLQQFLQQFCDIQVSIDGF